MTNESAGVASLATKFSLTLFGFASLFLLMFGGIELYYSWYKVNDEQESIETSIRETTLPLIQDAVKANDTLRLELQLRLIASEAYVVYVQFVDAFDSSLEIGHQIPLERQKSFTESFYIHQQASSSFPFLTFNPAIENGFLPLDTSQSQAALQQDAGSSGPQISDTVTQNKSDLEPNLPSTTITAAELSPQTQNPVAIDKNSNEKFSTSPLSLADPSLFTSQDDVQLSVIFDKTLMNEAIAREFINSFSHQVFLVILLLLLTLFGCVFVVSRPLKNLAEKLQQVDSGDMNRLIESPDTHPWMKTQEVEFLYTAVNAMRFSVHRQMTRQSVLQKRLARYATLLRVTNAQFRSIFEAIGDAVIVTNGDFEVEYFNQRAEKLEFCHNELHAGTQFLNLIAANLVGQSTKLKTQEFFIDPLHRGDASPASIEVELSADQAVSRQYMVSCSQFEIRSKDKGYVFFLSDVTENRALFSETQHLASHDYLTDFLNRYAFEQAIKPFLGQGYHVSQSIQTPTGVVFYVNINHFRIVNNSVGRLAGDELLRQVADAIRGCTTADDNIARLEGDIFAIVSCINRRSEAHAKAKAIYNHLSQMIFAWQQHRFEISISIGAVLLPHISKSVDDLLAVADGCCRRAKMNGREKIEFFSSHVEDVVLGQRREASSVLMLEESIRDKSLRLYLQPIVSVANEDTHGRCFEVLVRIRSLNGQLVYPNQFMPSAEHYQKVRIIDEYVISEFLAFAVEHNEWFNSLDHVAINLSGQSLNTQFMRDSVEGPILRLGLNPKSFCFEVTETVAVANLVETVAIISHMKQKGFRFSLDDFGTGFSSYEYLHHLPVNYLKIDGSFVRQICNNSMSYKVVESMNVVAHHAGIQTVAEYVETDEILAKVTQLSMDFAQGYVHGKARPIEDVANDFEQIA